MMPDIYCPNCGFELTEDEAELIAVQVLSSASIEKFNRLIEIWKGRAEERPDDGLPTFTEVVAKIRSYPEGAEVVLSAGEIAAIDNAFPGVHPERRSKLAHCQAFGRIIVPKEAT